jgi:hypothetical protein
MSPRSTRTAPVAAPAPAPTPTRRPRRTAAELTAAGITSKPRTRSVPENPADLQTALDYMLKFPECISPASREAIRHTFHTNPTLPPAFNSLARADKTRADAPLEHAVLVASGFADQLRADLHAARRESRLLTAVLGLAVLVLILICSWPARQHGYVGRALDGSAIALFDTTYTGAHDLAERMPADGHLRIGSDGHDYKLVVGNWFPVGVPPAPTPRNHVLKHEPGSAEARDTTPAQE